FSWVITSPPYYGMRTYVPDQWLRWWFLGGPSRVDYEPKKGHFTHSSPAEFIRQLRQVWSNTASACVRGARLVCRFGSIRDRSADGASLLKASLAETAWRVVTIRDAGSASDGKRQAAQFGERITGDSLRESDVYAILDR